MNNIDEALDRALRIEGAFAVALVDYGSGMTLGSRGGSAEFDLDVAAPGSWVVGPYQVNSGQISYYYLGGTSMASPHVAGIVALMAQKNPALTAAQAESIPTSTAIPLGAGCRTVNDGTGAMTSICWGTDATGSGLVTADQTLNAIP